MKDIQVCIADLFEPRLRRSRFKDLRSELESIASGIKTMSVFLFHNKMQFGRESQELTKICLELRLISIHYPNKFKDKKDMLDEYYVFVMREAELWRIQSYLALMRKVTINQWSDGLAAFESYLLGYSDEDFEKWVLEQKEVNFSWLGLNVYFFMTKDQMNSTISLGKKSLAPEFYQNGLELFYNRKEFKIKSNFQKNYDCEILIARVCVKREMFSKIFGPPLEWKAVSFISSKINKEYLTMFNAELVGNIQIYKDRNWN